MISQRWALSHCDQGRSSECCAGCAGFRRGKCSFASCAGLGGSGIRYNGTLSFVPTGYYYFIFRAKPSLVLRGVNMQNWHVSCHLAESHVLSPHSIGSGMLNIILVGYSRYYFPLPDILARLDPSGTRSEGSLRGRSEWSNLRVCTRKQLGPLRPLRARGVSFLYLVKTGKKSKGRPKYQDITRILPQFPGVAGGVQIVLPPPPFLRVVRGPIKHLISAFFWAGSRIKTGGADGLFAPSAPPVLHCWLGCFCLGCPAAVTFSRHRLRTARPDPSPHGCC